MSFINKSRITAPDARERMKAFNYEEQRTLQIIYQRIKNETKSPMAKGHILWDGELPSKVQLQLNKDEYILSKTVDMKEGVVVYKISWL